MIVGLATFIHGRDNRFLYVRNNPGMNQPHTDFVQCGRQVLQVCILGSTREDFIANDNQATGNDFGHRLSTTSTNGNDRAPGATWLFLPASNRHRRQDQEPFSG